MSDPARVVTAEELFESPDGKYHELVTRLVARLDAHVSRLGLGTVLVEAGYVLRRSPDTVRGPDVSFLSIARLPPDRIPVHFIPGAPDLAVEILSPTGGTRMV